VAAFDDRHRRAREPLLHRLPQLQLLAGPRLALPAKAPPHQPAKALRQAKPADTAMVAASDAKHMVPTMTALSDHQSILRFSAFVKPRLRARARVVLRKAVLRKAVLRRAALHRKPLVLVLRKQAVLDQRGPPLAAMANSFVDKHPKEREELVDLRVERQAVLPVPQRVHPLVKEVHRAVLLLAEREDSQAVDSHLVARDPPASEPI